ncbi:MAG: hypothetical protein ACXU82_17210 [Caulobacteraceae bacterium]
MKSTRSIRVSAAPHAGARGLLALAALLLATAAAIPSVAAAQVQPAWNTPIPAEFQNSWKAFNAMKAKAKPRKGPMPDWSGIWTRGAGGLKFDPAQPGSPADGKITAVLTPEADAKYRKKLAEVAKGVEWDQLSYCLPAGFPRWLTEPFLREFVVTPKQTWWIEEQQSEVRRIHTDGRGHVPEDEAFALWDGDSIGFWDGDTLVVHTIRVKPGQYQRSQPDYSDQTSTVERIRKINADTIEDQVTVWDPWGLKKPWTVVDQYTRVKTPHARIDMWSCEENNNVVKTSEGSSQFVLPGESGYKDPSKILKAPETGGK